MENSTPLETTLVKKKRLIFIDMGRSLAILLMLEGHFIEIVYRNFHPMIETIKQNYTSGNIFFDIWYFIKGYTAPMFFTITGIVFVFLLIQDKKFSENPRVKKGLKRVVELLFWGYLLQLNLGSLGNYLQGEFTSWMAAFHVLQSIGVGILFLILIYGLHKLINIGSLALYYFIFATLIFAFYPYFKSLPDQAYLPANAPEIIQNMFHGKYAVFAIVPWTAFVLYGGMFGAIIKKHKDNITSFKFVFLFVGIGIVLNSFAYPIFKNIDHFVANIGLYDDLNFVENAWLYGRLGQVLISLGILILIEKYLHFEDNLFLKVGQNTLQVYIVHVIILYGGIFGVGINEYWGDRLSGWQSIVGAIVFILSFIYMVKYWYLVDNTWTWMKQKLVKPFKQNSH